MAALVATVVEWFYDDEQQMNRMNKMNRIYVKIGDILPIQTTTTPIIS